MKQTKTNQYELPGQPLVLGRRNPAV